MHAEAVAGIVDRVATRYRRDPNNMLQILREVQEARDWVPQESDRSLSLNKLEGHKLNLETFFGSSSLIAHIRRISILLFALAVTACASLDSHELQPGVAKIDDVVSVMGQPAMRWLDADGSEQLAFPRGPAGTQTFMVFFGPDERLLRLEKVLEPGHFARIIPGQHDQADILRLLGPSNPAWTIYFKARDELAWEWLFCDDWSKLARFGVLFDATSGVVRSTYQQPELPGPRGVAPSCGH